MNVGLNAGFGDSLAGEFAGMASYGFAVARQDLFPHDDASRVSALVTEFAGAPVRPLFLIGGGHMQHADGTRIDPSALAAWTTQVVETARAVGVTDYALEIGNEPDIAHPWYARHPANFADAVRQCHGAARSQGFTGSIVTGGIANLDNRGFAYLARVLAVSILPVEDLVIGFHRYPEAGRGPLAPHDRFRSRDDEWSMLLKLVGTRPVACTEFGYHTATEPDGHTRTDPEVAESVLWDLEFFEERAVQLACVYQLNDGPTDTWIDRFGVRALDGNWKPVAESIRETYGPAALV
jgi:hypothetical protein